MANRDIEEIILLAKDHGEESEPDMEIGDLQAALRLVWKILTAYQQEVVLKQIKEEVFE